MKLQEGDSVGILSTARAIDFSEIELADALLRSWGYKPVYGNTIGLKHGQFAGTDAERSADLQTMLDDASMKAILFARGGYGSIRILDRIDFTGFLKYPKLLCGFSDVTVFHAHVNDKLGLHTVHSSMPYSFPGNTIEALDSLRNILSGDYRVIETAGNYLNIAGEASGVLIGGNLSILYSLLGTRYGFNTAGKILFIEDIDEYLYHIDRMMMSMQLAGKLKDLKGVIVGDFTDMKDNKVPFGKTAEEIINSYIEPLGIPVCYKFPSGHIADNRALVLGRQIQLKVGETVTLRYI